MLKVVIPLRKSNFSSGPDRATALYTGSIQLTLGVVAAAKTIFRTWKMRTRARPISQLVGTPAPLHPVLARGSTLDPSGGQYKGQGRQLLWTGAQLHMRTHIWNDRTAGVLLRGRGKLSPGEKKQHKPKEVSNVGSSSVATFGGNNARTHHTCQP